MSRFSNPWAVSLLSLAALLPTSVHAQVCVQPAPAVSTFAPPPAVSFNAAPTMTFAAPGCASPAVTFSYYPSTVFAAPAVVPAGTVTTRSFYGFGIFRPRGWYTESTFTPFGR